MSESVHRSLKRNSWEASSPPSHLDAIPAGFHCCVMGTVPPGTGACSWGAEWGSGTRHFSGGISSAELSLLVLNCHTVYIWELPALPTSLIGASLSP